MKSNLNSFDTKFNRSDYLILIIVYSAVIIFNTIEYYAQENMLIEYLVDIPVSVITSFSAIVLFTYWLIPKYLIKKKYITFIVLGIITLTLLGITDYTAGFLSEGRSWNKYPTWNKLLLVSIFRTANYAGFIFGILLAKRFYEGKIEFSKIEKQQKENELKLLRSQIDPHFLFNNLNTLDSLIDSDSEKAKEYINRLSLIYRYLIQTKDAEVMELTSELQFTENYIFLIETRFGDDYHFTIKKEATITDKFIPTGALQTLLENIVKHNKANGQPVLSNISIDNDWLTVNNTKTNNANNESFGTGLQNLQARYTLLSDKKIIITNENNSFTVSIPIIQLSDEN